MPDNHHIIARERVIAEAREAARKFEDVNAACPYPFDTEAGRLFKAEFAAMRCALGSSEGLQP